MERLARQSARLSRASENARPRAQSAKRIQAMNEFEHRWKMGLEAARLAAAAQSDEAPLGFATRVIAHWQAQPEPPLALLWQRLALRVLGAMALVLLTLAAYGAFSLEGDAPLHPPVENAVADEVWFL